MAEPDYTKRELDLIIDHQKENFGGIKDSIDDLTEKVDIQNGRLSKVEKKVFVIIVVLAILLVGREAVIPLVLKLLAL